MKDRVEQYEREARAAEEAAARAPEGPDRQAFLKVAEGWRRLAKLAAGRWTDPPAPPKAED